MRTKEKKCILLLSKKVLKGPENCKSPGKKTQKLAVRGNDASSVRTAKHVHLLVKRFLAHKLGLGLCTKVLLHECLSLELVVRIALQLEIPRQPPPLQGNQGQRAGSRPLTWAFNHRNLLAGSSRATLRMWCCRSGGTSSRRPSSEMTPVGGQEETDEKSGGGSGLATDAPATRI